MSNAMRYRVEFEGSDEIGYSAYLPELPGCVAAGETFEKTKELIAEAVGLHLERMEEEELLILDSASLLLDCATPQSTIAKVPSLHSLHRRRIQRLLHCRQNPLVHSHLPQVRLGQRPI